MAIAKGHIGFKTKYAIAALAVAFVVAIIADVAWTATTQEWQMETELHEKGKVLSQQMASVWEFMTANQDRFEEVDYSVTGSYQGLHCAVAGRTISKLFTLESGYVTRYVNFNPRNVEDTPDVFESEALEAFYSNEPVDEYYGLVDYNGRRSYRYLAPMEVKEACLKCHGAPVGELDLTGNPKEGWVEGQVGGAISIVIPLDIYEESMHQNIVQSVIFSGALLLVLAAIVVLVAKLLSKANQVLETQKAQLEKTNELLAEESQHKTDFLNIVSHELRTPLTSIVAFSEMLDAEQSGGEKGNTIRQGIGANSRALLLKVNNLLEAGRFNAGRMRLDEGIVDMCELAGMAELVISPLAQQSGLKLNIEVGEDIPLVKGDFDKLLQILENLLSNAVKFTPRGGEVALSISYHEDESTVWMQVLDTGVGIAPEDIERVFRPFESSSSTEKGKYYGTGLGLPFVKTCAEMHGGSIRVDSKVGAGSVFTVVLPADNFEEGGDDA